MATTKDEILLDHTQCSGITEVHYKKGQHALAITYSSLA